MANKTEKKSKNAAKKSERKTKGNGKIKIKTAYVIIAAVALFVIATGAIFAYMTYFNDKEKVETGDMVKVWYVGELEDGTVFDTNIPEIAKKNNITERNQTLDFTAGSGMVIKGFDDGVIGMKAGQEKKIEIEPENAYGTYDASKVVSGIQIKKKIDKMMPVARNILVPIDKFKEIFGEEAVEGEMYTTEELPWQLRAAEVNETTVKMIGEPEIGKSYVQKNAQYPIIVVEMNETSIIIEQDIKDGQIIQTELGPTQITEEGDKLVFKVLLNEGDQMIIQGRQATVKDLGEEYTSLDFNHRLAGKKLIFTVTVDEILKR